jgi:hypothetical protein
MTRNVTLKLQATRALVARLNPARRAYWSRLLDSAQRQAERKRAGGGVEWTAERASWLDRVHLGVGAEVARLPAGPRATLARVGEQVGELRYTGGPVPLILLGVAAWYLWRHRRK